MDNFDDLIEEQKKLNQRVVDASTKEVAQIKTRLEAISAATGKTIASLLGIRGSKTPTTDKKSTVAKPDAAKDKKYRDWIKASKDQTHKIGGKDKLIKEDTRLTQNIRDYVDSLGA